MTGSVSTVQGPVSWTVSTDSNGIVLASFSKNANGVTGAVGTCWYAADNQANISYSPYDGPANAGVFYAKAAVVPTSPSASQTSACNSASVPTVTWATSFANA